ncbi:hypothetical protein Tco_0217694 [Tanacetum coccineum]
MDEQSIRLPLKEQSDSFTSQSAKVSAWPSHGSGSNDQGAQSRLLQKGVFHIELKAQLRKQLEKQTSQRSDEVKEKQDMCSTERSKVAPSERKTWSNHVLPYRPPGIVLVESKFRKRLRI